MLRRTFGCVAVVACGLMMPVGAGAATHHHTRHHRRAHRPSARAAVVGGTTIDIDSAPWTAYVQETVQDASGQTEIYGCDGAIIDSSHVVTAAHCVTDDLGQPEPPADFLVVVGT